MLEYHAHIGTLEAARSALGALADPQIAEAKSAAVDAVDREPSIARLGSCLDMLLAHSASDGLELELLQRASDLWQRSLKIYEEVGTARLEFELSLVRTDLPDAVQVLQMGINRFYQVSQDAKLLLDNMKDLRAAILPLDHIKAHPRQADVPATEWSWGDAFLGRRTLAFVRSLFGNAVGDRGLSFAMGALAGYAGNVAGSAYLGSVVGGPRRLHRFRDRLGRNTLGAWMHQFVATPAPSEIARDLLLNGDRGQPSLPLDIEAQLRSSLAAAFPNRTPPDISLGYRRMLQHLELLDGFRVPSPPLPPPVLLSAGFDGTIQTNTFDDGAMGPPGTNDDLVGKVPDTSTQDPGPSSSKSAGGDICLYAILSLGTIFVIYGIWCISRLLDEKKCGVEDFLGESNPPPDPRDPPVTQQTLEIMRKPEQAGHLFQDIFELQMRLWQAFETAREFLIVTGLIYPDQNSLGTPLHSQFLQPEPKSQWPLREEPNAGKTYHAYPNSAPEAPMTGPPFPPNRSPEWLLQPNPVDNESTVAEIAIDVFRSLYDGRGEETLSNLDLDADRGRRHPCWAVMAGTAIHDQPIAVDILSFDKE